MYKVKEYETILGDEEELIDIETNKTINLFKEKFNIVSNKFVNEYGVYDYSGLGLTELIFPDRIKYVERLNYSNNNLTDLGKDMWWLEEMYRWGNYIDLSNNKFSDKYKLHLIKTLGYLIDNITL